jgi:hypothetical protein
MIHCDHRILKTDVDGSLWTSHGEITLGDTHAKDAAVLALTECSILIDHSLSPSPMMDKGGSLSGQSIGSQQQTVKLLVACRR